MSNSELPSSKFYEILSTALFWVTMQQVVVIPYRLIGTTYRSHLQGSRTRTNSFFPETSAKNCHYSLRNPEERSSHLLRSGSPKSRIVYEILFINSVYLSRQEVRPVARLLPSQYNTNPQTIQTSTHPPPCNSHPKPHSSCRKGSPYFQIWGAQTPSPQVDYTVYEVA